MHGELEMALQEPAITCFTVLLRLYLEGLKAKGLLGND
jgi:hypothetical protein